MIKIEYKPYITRIDDLECMVMTEANLNRIVKGHDEYGYAIISACRSDIYKNTNGDYSLDSNDETYNGYEKVTDEQEMRYVNNTNTEKLKNMIRDKGYSYIQVFGGYKEKSKSKTSYEKSFIVFPYNIRTKEYTDFNIFFDDMIKWIQNDDIGFNQDSVLIKKPNENPKYFNQDGKAENEFGFSNVKLNDVTQEYFTSLKKWKDDFDIGKPQRFTFTNEIYIRKFPATINEHRRRSMSGELVDLEFYFQ